MKAFRHLLLINPEKNSIIMSLPPAQSLQCSKYCQQCQTHIRGWEKPMSFHVNTRSINPRLQFQSMKTYTFSSLFYVICFRPEHNLWIKRDAITSWSCTTIDIIINQSKIHLFLLNLFYDSIYINITTSHVFFSKSSKIEIIQVQTLLEDTFPSTITSVTIVGSTTPILWSTMGCGKGQ